MLDVTAAKRNTKRIIKKYFYRIRDFWFKEEMDVLEFMAAITLIFLIAVCLTD